MSGHLCLKWNNHSTAFIKSISNIQIKERYCDATIACQGKYFPVHRVVLSTCSDYFDEMFERMQCQHPYIVFKDIEPREMELLLNYMYQGEVNVVQENLPTLIKAAEALKVKGLAVPDDLPSNKESSGRKRGNTSNDMPVPKRRSEEKRRRGDSDQHHPSTSNSDRESKLDHLDNMENKVIKAEPLDTGYNDQRLSTDYGGAAYSGGDSAAESSQANSSDKTEGVFVNFPLSEEPEPYVKQEEQVPTDTFNDEQSSSWSDFASGDIMQDLPETSGQDDMSVEISENSTASQYVLQHPQTKEFKCSLCSYTHLKRQEIVQHVMFKHIGERSFSCSVCKESFSTNEILNQHYRTHDDERHFSCSICGKRFKLKQHLDYHNRAHTGEKPFPCSVCGKRFSLKTSLNIHFRTHTGEKPFSCHVCGKKFVQKIHLQKHRRIHFGDN